MHGVFVGIVHAAVSGWEGSLLEQLRTMQTKKLNYRGIGHAVALALGSNLGDRFANIELALRLLEGPDAAKVTGVEGAYATVVDTSFLYETEPMYETDQPMFINCACLVSKAWCIMKVQANHI